MVRLPSKTKPIFADEIMVSFVIKKSKDGKKKDAVIRIGFVDSMRKEIISDIVVSPVTAFAMAEILAKTNEKVEATLSGKYDIKKHESSTATYIG